MEVVSDTQYLIAELSHQINSPLAAIRNALYLASSRSQDPQVLHYLNLADEEISAITAILHATRILNEGIAQPAVEAPVALSTLRAAA
jgi:signal transduction histidine kinase